MRWLHRRRANKLFAAYTRAADSGWVVAASLAWTRYAEYCADHQIERTGQYRWR